MQRALGSLTPRPQNQWPSGAVLRSSPPPERQRRASRTRSEQPAQARPHTAGGASAEASDSRPPQRPAGRATRSGARCTARCTARSPAGPRARREPRSRRHPDSPAAPPLLTTHGGGWGGPAGCSGLGAVFAGVPLLRPRSPLQTRSGQPRAGSSPDHVAPPPDKAPAVGCLRSGRPPRCHGHGRRSRP